MAKEPPARKPKLETGCDPVSLTPPGNQENCLHIVKKGTLDIHPRSPVLAQADTMTARGEDWSIEDRSGFFRIDACFGGIRFGIKFLLVGI